MKKILFAALLLTTGVAGTTELFANSTVKVAAALPKQVQNAFAALQAQYAANNQVLTNVVWTHNGNTYTATFVIVDMSVEDSYTNGTTAFHANGTQVQ
ncbi:MAG: hypothetical protein EOO12_14220 [Chitinophagaceae bacterium]|nr:MAG: hypothetical protein EOO12_14220 [Chitinophagaceae bacterium]